jgi:hypothetical protein
MPKRAAPLPLVLLALALLGAAIALWRPRVGPPPAPTRPGPQADPPETDAALFAEITEKAGLSFTHRNGAGKYVSVEFSSGGGALFDADNDGWLDILLLQAGPSERPETVKDRPHGALYRNKGDGTFEDITAGSGIDRDLGYAQGVAVGDIDNDGRDELVVTAYGRITLLRATDGARPRYADVTKGSGLDVATGSRYFTSAAFGDIDNDGFLDLYICCYNDWTHGAASSQPFPDLGAPVTHRLFRNTGTGTFVDITHKAGIDQRTGRGLAVAFLDVNDDGKPDIFVACDRTPHLLWRNRGDGTFVDDASRAGCALSETGQTMAGMGIALADIDHTGRESLAVTNFTNLPTTLFRAEGDGLFAAQSARAGLGTAIQPKPLGFGGEFVDIDADGWPDLILTNGHVYPRNSDYRQPRQLYRNQGGGRFVEVTDPARLGRLAAPRVGRGLAVGDIDNDGRPDLLLIHQNEPVQLFRNRDKSGNHWLALHLEGTRSNRNALGAKVTVTAGGEPHTARVRSGSSYLSVSDRRLFFGLGKATAIDAIDIRWPSGRRERIAPLALDAGYRVIEGKGVAGKLPYRQP